MTRRYNAHHIRKDDARLMAAAPELVALLSQAEAHIAFLVNTTTSETNRVNGKQLLSEIGAALLKARGAR